MIKKEAEKILKYKDLITEILKLKIKKSCNTIYPRNMVCFRYIIVNTLHKGDNKCNNNNKSHFSETVKRINEGTWK